MVGASELIITINITTAIIIINITTAIVIITAIIIINITTVIIIIKYSLHKGKRSNLKAQGIFLDLFDKVMLVCGPSGLTITLPVMARCDYYNYNYCYGKVRLH